MKTLWKTRFACFFFAAATASGIDDHVGSSLLSLDASALLDQLHAGEKGERNSLDLARLAHPKKAGISDACHKLESFEKVFCEIALQVMCTQNSEEEERRAVAKLQNRFLRGPAAAPRFSMSSKIGSSLTTSATSAAPGIHKSFHCQFCAYQAGQITGYDPDGYVKESAGNIRWNTQHKWETFLKTAGLSPRISFEWRPGSAYGDDCERRITKPAFVLHMMGWHIGHLIVDTLEALHYAHIKHFGRVNPDTFLIIDVSEKDGMQPYTTSLMARDAFGGNTPFELLRAFTRHPIISKKALDGLSGKTCFEFLQAELDLNDAFTTMGQLRHPEIVGPADIQGVQGKRYRSFQHFIASFLGISAEPAARRGGVAAFVDRKGKRTISNALEVKELFEAAAFDVKSAHLEDLTFTQQVKLLQDSQVYVCQQGTALHNVLFMKPGSIVVILMQPDWCDWKWKFANQAALLRMHVIVYCSDMMRFQESKFSMMNITNSYRWNDRAWLQGPWYSKDARMRVDARTAERIAALASRIVREKKSEPRIYEPFCPPGDYNSVDKIKVDADASLLAIARVADFSVDFKTDNSAVIKCVPEVLLTNHLGATDLHLSLPSLEFCIEPIGTNSHRNLNLTMPTSCLNSRLLGTHATLDLHMPTRIVNEGLVFKFWLQDASSGVSIKDSESYASTALFREFESFSSWYSKNRTLFFSYNVDGTPYTYACRLPSMRFAKDVCAMKLSLQCKAHRMTNQQCAVLLKFATKALQKELASAESGLPAVHFSPDSRHPFYFLHLEKTAGTCLRHHLSKYTGVHSIIPCHANLHCMTFTLNYSDHDAFVGSDGSVLTSFLQQPPAIVAGHFQWNEWQHIDTASDRDIFCFTNMRHPVKRVISLYYERLYPLNGRRKLSDLSVKELVFYLAEWRGSAHGRWRDEGMSNAACRMMCGQNVAKGRLPSKVGPRKDLCSFDEIQNRASKCLIGIQEEWNNTMRVLARWAPWIDTRADCPRGNGGRNEGLAAEKPNELPSILRDAILSYNQCDLKLYEYGQSRFALQLEALL